MSNLRQGLNQKLLQKLSPQQIQLMKLLQIPVANLEQRIKEEMQDNPALEEGADQEEDEYESTTKFLITKLLLTILHQTMNDGKCL